MSRKWIIVLLAITAMVIACRHETDELVEPGEPRPVSNSVNVDLAQVPYQTLSQYNFFTGDMASHTPNSGVLPYDVITPLFSDYAHKMRFVWMPEGVQATYNGADSTLAFPVGTVLIKTFYYDNVQPGDTRRILETRLLIRRSDGWVFADYTWNDAQTEAYMDLNGHFTPLTWRDDQGTLHDVNYRIPAGAECFTCHKLHNVPIPIGTKARNLKRQMDYPEGTRDQLEKWVAMGYLESGFPEPEPIAKWNDPSVSLNDRVRAYVEMNCSHCHSEGKHCDYRPMRFAWQDSGLPVNMGVCVPPEDPLPGQPQLTYIVAAGDLEHSMMLHRISSTDEAVRMPLMGRTVVHQEAVNLVSQWILSLDGPCN